jgi:hypothetical protein
MEPHRIEWRRDGEVFSIVLERITHNAPVGKDAFDLPPDKVEGGLDVEGLLSAAAEAERRADGQRTAYAYTQSMFVRTIDQQGRTTERSGSAFEIFHLGGRAVGRQIRKVDGTTLSEAERRREDRRVGDIVRAYERAGSGALPRREDIDVSSFALRGLGGSLVLRVPVITTGWLPAYRRMSEFSSVRRERVGTRTAVVMDFQPKGGVAASGDVERQAIRMAGTLWIDEASQQLIRLESHFIDDYESVVTGSSIWVEQTLVNGEVWLPSRVETNVRRSLAFGALAQPLATVLFTGHKKFGVETDAAIALPDVN